MNREIKFRAWDKGSHQMYEVGDPWDIHEDGQDFDHESNSMFINREYELIEKADITFMQYTGLKDKNGRDIYEGDVLRFKAFGGKQQGSVRWDEGCANYQLDMSATSSTGFFRDPMRVYEVIGNIYENPELLKADLPERS